ncbi:hypothetical protein [Algoriphagus hitonicola]|uniref:Uncharacterized protein n=1 Tax=Algoriphagus hitonicola TaxID=435880 RepID=A0A1I2Q5F5_9BACT|nr:hypothetical protein [Algoriphagus hitonicola]SFG21477.1 hypothetical protein SAMN04487988_10249 [Algoriphagus hitonicola]
MYFKKILILVLLAPILFISSQRPDYLMEGEPIPAQQAVEYRLVVKVINDEWRVVFDGDETRSDVVLRRGDRIRWVVEGSDASFAFPDTRIFGLETRDIKDGNPLVMAVSANAPEGTYAYSVFIHEAMTYARGQSPPRIIITE